MNNRELKAENEQLTAQIADLQKQLADAAAALAAAQQTAASKPVSKGKQQAEAAYALLQKGPVTLADLKAINEKYPNDPIYFVRTILKHEITTNRQKGGKTTYSLKAAEVVAAPPAPEAPSVPAPEVASTPAPEVTNTPVDTTESAAQ